VPIKTHPITQFKGLNERLIIGSTPLETTSLDNVIVRNGEVRGRKGINEWNDITTAETDTPIIGLAAYYRATNQTTTLLRMMPLSVKVWNSATSAWDNITGTALTGDSTTRPQFTTMGELDLLMFTNEGNDRPRKYSGTGNTTELGGTPPFAKAIESYVGFLALGNTSDDGVTFSPLQVVMSDDPDNTWTDCSDTDIFVVTMTLDESPGEVLALKAHGMDMYAYKSDAIVQIKLTGGVTRFQRRKLDFPMGILAPLSLQQLGELGQIFLAQDRNLYVNNGQTVQALPPHVQKSLQETMSAAKAPFVRSAVDLDNETYHLFYQRSGSTYLDGRLSFNYRTGEFYKGVYPVEFNSALGFRTANTAAWKVLASSSTLTYELDTGTNDNGTAVSRYYDIDWTQFGSPGNKWFTGGEFVFEKARDCRVRISVAVDKSSKFSYRKTFTLQGNDPDETETRVEYNLPSPVFGSWFKVRVEMLHDDSTNVVKLKEFQPEIIPMAPYSADTSGQPQPLAA
jgi:hypothetical protein